MKEKTIKKRSATQRCAALVRISEGIQCMRESAKRCFNLPISCYDDENEKRQIQFRKKIAFIICTLLALLGCDDSVITKKLVNGPTQIYKGEEVTEDVMRPWATAATFIWESDGGVIGYASGTHITPNLILTAKHNGTVSNASFYTYDANGAVPSSTQTIITDPDREYDIQGDADLSIRVLDTPPPGVEPYWNPNLSKKQSLYGHTLEIGGYGTTIRHLYQALDCQVHTDWYIYDGRFSKPGDVRFEYDCEYPYEDSNGIFGDSGAGVFLSTGELTGIHFQSPDDISVGNYLPYPDSGGDQPYWEWIENIINIEDPEWVDFYNHMDLPVLSSHTDVLSRFSVFATDSVDFHDRATFSSGSGDNSLTYGNRVHIGSEAELRTVFVGDNGALLRNGAVVDGDIIAEGGIRKEGGPVVVGDEIYYKHVDMPSLYYVQWDGPNSSTGAINVNAGESESITAGNYYGDVTINGGDLVFNGCGKYYFNSLIVNSGSRLTIPGATCGPLMIYVRTGLIYRGKTKTIDNTRIDASQFIVSAWGQYNAILLQKSFIGTVIAPNGTVHLDCGKVLTGAAYGRNVTIFQDAIVNAREGGIRTWFENNQW